MSNPIHPLMEAQLARIRAKIALIHGNEWLTRGTFTGWEHGFVLNPVVAPEVIEALEKKHHFVLPEAYRLFLLTVGNGGLGPDYGLSPFSRLEEAYEYFSRELDLVGEPCPLIPGQTLPKRHWERVFDLDDITQHQGTIMIADCGDDISIRLIVTGPARGHVVILDNEWRRPVFPYRSEFLGWYEGWLDYQIVTKQLAEALSSFVMDRQLGVVNGETRRYKVFGNHYCRSTISYISTEKQVGWAPKEAYQYPPDLAIELNIADYYSLINRLSDYLAAGTTVWIVYVKAGMISVCRPNKPVSILYMNDTLTGDDILPDFAMPLAEVFANVMIE